MEAGTGGRVEVEDDDRDRDLRSERKRDQVGDLPAVIGGDHREHDGRDGEDQPHCRRVEDDDPDIGVPA